MLAALNRWMWKGTFDPTAERLPVQTELAPEVDLAGAVTAVLAELNRQVDSLKAAAERRRAADAPRVAPGAATGSSEAEIRQIAKSMLPSLDALDRIVEFGESVAQKDETFANWMATVSALRVRLLRTLEGIGLVPITSVGCEVDFELHDVTALVPRGEFAPNTIVREQQRGYFFRGKLVRDAKVVVAQ